MRHGSWIAAGAMAVTIVTPSVAMAAPSSGDAPISAAARTSLELVAERTALAGTNGQRAAVGVAPVEGWTDILTVARAWSDRIDGTSIAHNPSYSSQYGAWAGAAENVAARAVAPASTALTAAAVEDATLGLLASWWASDGHRRTIVDGAFDHAAVGASIQRATLSSGDEYWVLVLTANFRAHDGSDLSGWSSYAASQLPPDEDATIVSTPAPTAVPAPTPTPPPSPTAVAAPSTPPSAADLATPVAPPPGLVLAGQVHGAAAPPGELLAQLLGGGCWEHGPGTGSCR